MKIFNFFLLSLFIPATGWAEFKWNGTFKDPFPVVTKSDLESTRQEWATLFDKSRRYDYPGLDSPVRFDKIGDALEKFSTTQKQPYIDQMAREAIARAREAFNREMVKVLRAAVANALNMKNLTGGERKKAVQNCQGLEQAIDKVMKHLASHRFLLAEKRFVEATKQDDDVIVKLTEALATNVHDRFKDLEKWIKPESPPSYRPTNWAPTRENILYRYLQEVSIIKDPSLALLDYSETVGNIAQYIKSRPALSGVGFPGDIDDRKRLLNFIMEDATLPKSVPSRKLPQSGEPNLRDWIRHLVYFSLNVIPEHAKRDFLYSSKEKESLLKWYQEDLSRSAPDIADPNRNFFELRLKSADSNEWQYTLSRDALTKLLPKSLNTAFEELRSDVKNECGKINSKSNWPNEELKNTIRNSQIQESIQGYLQEPRIFPGLANVIAHSAPAH